MLQNFFTVPTIKSERVEKKKAIILIYKSLKETFFQKNASSYICFVPDHLEIEFIWISVQGLRRFKKQTEVIISCKLISIF